MQEKLDQPYLICWLWLLLILFFKLSHTIELVIDYLENMKIKQ